MIETSQFTTTTLRLIILLIISTALISCSAFSVDSPNQVTPTQSPTSFTSTPRPRATATLTLSATAMPTPSATAAASITPSPTNIPVCVASTNAPETEGWNCLNQSYGFTLHFPSPARFGGTLRPEGDTLIVWLENSQSNPRVERMLYISLGENAESCISPDSETIQIGEQKFIVKHGIEPSGIVYEWRSYATTNESKSVCFFFTFGFQTWEKDDPLVPPEKDQGLNEVEAILATFQWLNP
jgi:hypothetical protein